MKLDESVIETIVEEVSTYDFERYLDSCMDSVRAFLQDFDLVIKPDDPSQSVLVENE